jgi:predicted DNA-binding protein (UPF0251 family)
VVTYEWTLLEVPGVAEVIEQASSKVARHFELDADDLAQEGRLRVTDLRKNLAECISKEEPDLGLLQYRLEQDLVDLARVEVSKRARNTSYEERYDGNEDRGDYAPRPANITIRQEVGGYTRELVESLIPAVWDESYCYGMRVENAPDGDMPRASANKATGNTLAAHIADIKTGWAKAPLSVEEQRAVLLCYGMDWTQSDAAYNQGVSQQTISNRLYVGIGKIVATLNGDDRLLVSLEEPVKADFELVA